MNEDELTTPGYEDSQDDILSSLTNIAYATPSLQKHSQPRKYRRSRFFFKPTTSFTQQVEKSKKSLTKKVSTSVELLDEEVEKRRVIYKKELPKKLKSNIEDVREFFLRDIGPHVLAVQAGVAQAQDVVQKTIETEVDGTMFLQFQSLLSQAVTLKMTRFIAKYLKLPLSTVEALIAEAKGVPPKEVYFFSNPAEERRTREKQQVQPPASE